MKTGNYTQVRLPLNETHQPNKSYRINNNGLPQELLRGTMVIITVNTVTSIIIVTITLTISGNVTLTRGCKRGEDSDKLPPPFTILLLPLETQSKFQEIYNTGTYRATDAKVL